MQLHKPSDFLKLSIGDSITKRNVFDLIQLSKVEGSAYWEDRSWTIGNTPQQGINWAGDIPDCRFILIKARPGAYENDGWADNGQTAYRYSFKARSGIIYHSEKANRVLVDQPDYQYPVLLLTEVGGSWVYEGQFFVSEIMRDHIVLSRIELALQKRQTTNPQSPRQGSSETDDSVAIDWLLSDPTIPRTERTQLIKARIGQGLFRARVAAVEHCCRITGIVDSRFLIASHIKPWAKSSNAEKLDGHNGLLLTPNIDRLFDKGYITFEDNGQVRVSSQVPPSVIRAWGINNAISAKPLVKQQLPYMAYHRSTVFRK